MKSFYKKARGYVLAHKFVSGVLLVIILGAAYFFYSLYGGSSTKPQYILGTVEHGSVIASITGTGQVSASNQIDIKPKVGGDVTYVGVGNGTQVKAGALLFMLDSTSAQKAVRDAQMNLESAELSYQKLVQPADTLSLLQAKNALTQATADSQKAYDNSFTGISNAFLDLPSVMTGLQNILYKTDLSNGVDNVSAYADLVKNYDDSTAVATYRDDAVTQFQAALKAYNQTFSNYKAASQYSSTSTVTNLVQETYNTSKTMAGAVKSMSDLLNFVKDHLTAHNASVPSVLTSHQTLLGTYTTLTNSHITDLYSILNTINTSAQTIEEKQQALIKLQNGADPLDVSSNQLSVKQRQNALQDAQESLADYFVRAPFDGTVANVTVTKGMSVGAGSAIATMITSKRVATISLNEVDIAKVQVGDKVTLTFDAVDGLSIAGEVAEINPVGTVSQGVVSYSVKITFDTADERIKSGMSVNAAIITDTRIDVLTVPNGALKSNIDGSFYVEMFPENVTGNASNTNAVTSAVSPTQVSVEAGLSDDTNTEIISGLKEGDRIITRTVNVSIGATTNQTPSLFQAAGVRTQGGGNVRTGTAGR